MVNENDPKSSNTDLRSVSSSSGLSESLCEEILGREACKLIKERKLQKKLGKPTPRSNYTDSANKINRNLSKSGSYHSTAGGSKDSLKGQSSKYQSNDSGERKSKSGGSGEQINETPRSRHKSGFLKQEEGTKSNNTPTVQSKSGSRSHEGSNKSMHTQTVGIQTAVAGAGPESDCKCPQCRKTCSCPTCNPQRGCTFKYFDANYTNALTDTTQRKSWEEYDSTEDLLSEQSEDCYGEDFFQLPYQNNEEYNELLNELERKLVKRNKERVRKTMQEFEKRCRQNNPNPEPRYCSDDSCLVRRAKTARPKGRPCCCRYGHRSRVNSDIMQNEQRLGTSVREKLKIPETLPLKQRQVDGIFSFSLRKCVSLLNNWCRWERTNFVESVVNSMDDQGMNCYKFERTLHRSHWQLDPRSGEWIKVPAPAPDVCQPCKHADGEEDDVMMIKAPPKCKKDCCCNGKRCK